MKSRYKILSIIIIIVILFLIFLNLPTIHKLPLCDEGYVSIAGDCILNYDLLSILRGMIQERMDYQYFTNLIDESSDEDQNPFIRINDDSFTRQSLQTGETISTSSTFTSLIVGSLGPILIVLFIVIYAVKKRRKKSIEERK